MTYWLIVLSITILGLIIKSFFPSYFGEKGKNLATLEDIEKITDKVEGVRSFYDEKSTQLEHQNSLILEAIQSRNQLQNQLRVAAIEKRLEVHQQAFALWRELLSKVHTDEIHDKVIECQEWWENNCLYLSPEAREAFNKAYFAAASHKTYLQDRSNIKLIEANMKTIMSAGDVIVSAVKLPSLGSREVEDVLTPNTQEH